MRKLKNTIGFLLLLLAGFTANASSTELETCEEFYYQLLAEDHPESCVQWAFDQANYDDVASGGTLTVMEYLSLADFYLDMCESNVILDPVTIYGN
ncbi:hypothetical protein [uncultured Dokdonia sp.]|uniref:hypothetical protein n=1 Tax=uncultured Dokdonia sp. TaxID=575653 RepID=UPI0026381D53|nr:hypothetical protein [uncultured Dokdonia sp.]